MGSNARRVRSPLRLLPVLSLVGMIQMLPGITSPELLDRTRRDVQLPSPEGGGVFEISNLLFFIDNLGLWIQENALRISSIYIAIIVIFGLKFRTSFFHLRYIISIPVPSIPKLRTSEFGINSPKI